MVSRRQSPSTSVPGSPSRRNDDYNSATGVGDRREYSAPTAMVIFWIFAALESLSAFGYGMFLMQWGVVGSLLYPFATLLLSRGLLSWLLCTLILRVCIADF